MKGIWEYFPRHSSGEYKVQRNASCAVNAMAKKLLSPPPLLPSPRNTRHKCTGPEGRGERKMASHFLGGPINFLQRRRNSRSWWKIPVHKHDIKDVDEDPRPKGDGGKLLDK